MERLKLALERARAQSPSQYAVVPVRSARIVDFRHPPGKAADPWAALEVQPLDPVHLEQHRIVGLQHTNPLRQSFDLLRTQVLQKMQEHGWRTIAVTSPSPQSGKSVVAINLAMSIAHHPTKTALLVDFDLRRPAVASYLGLPARRSLNEVLAGEAPIESAVVHAGIPGFLVLPTQRRVAGAAEILASDRIGDMIADMRDGYAERTIVIDLPPVTAVDDVIAVLPQVDCVLVVIGNGTSTKPEIEESKRHLARYNVLGVVVNKAPMTTLHSNYY